MSHFNLAIFVLKKKFLSRLWCEVFFGYEYQRKLKFFNTNFSIFSSIARYLARTAGDLMSLYGGEDLVSNTEIDHWLTFSLGPLGNHGEFKNALNYLNDILAPITFLVGDSVSIADYVVFGTLFGSGFWQVKKITFQIIICIL